MVKYHCIITVISSNHGRAMPPNVSFMVVRHGLTVVSDVYCSSE